MARVMVDNQNVVAPWRSNISLAAVAAVAGLAWWVTASLLARYVIEPLACRSSATLAACGDVPTISGSIAVVVVAAGVLLALVMMRRSRPVLIAAGAAIMLWGLGLYTAGLSWYEALVWAILAYVSAHFLMYLISRMRGAWRSLASAAVVVLGVKLLVAF